jgi:tetratricopeptide (TPR) repeat protein
MDAENTDFAETLLASTLLQRARMLSSAILGDGGPDPRWPQLRAVAVAGLERSVGLKAEQPEANLLIARLHALPAGDRDRAIKAATAVIDAKEVEAPTRSMAYLVRAGLQEDDAKRKADFDRAVDVDPNKVEALRARGLFHLLKEEHAAALADLDAALQKEPDHGPTHEARGMALFMAGKYADAIKSFTKAIELSPHTPTPYLHRARSYALNDNMKGALEDLDKLLGLNPDAVPALLLRAQVHAQNNDGEKALADVDRAIRVRPGYLPALQLRAQLLAGTGKVEEAIDGLERLTEAAPKNAELQLQLARFYLADDRPRRAIEIFNELLAVDGDNWEVLRSRGDARLSIAQHGPAIEDYEKALKLKPGDSGILNNLAWVMATSPDEKVRNGKRAVELAKQACEATEYKQGHILSTLAAAYAEAGDFGKAKEWSQKAVDIGRDEQKEQLRAELASYEKKEPWRELQTTEEKKPEKTDKGEDPAEPDAAPAQTSDL